MTLEQLIARARETLNARINTRNGVAQQLNAARAAETPDNAQVEQLRTQLTAADAEVDQLRGNLTQLEEEQTRDQAVARLQSEITPTEPATTGGRGARASVTHEPNPVYRRGSTDASFFRDLHNASRGERAAQDRLIASQERALTTGAGTGGEFAPPAWMIEDFIGYTRGARITADLMNTLPLPEGVASINIPKIASGTAVKVTQTQNTTITDVTLTTTSVSSGVAEITGKQVVPLALLRAAGTPIDDIILSDLGSAYAASLDLQVIAGSAANGELRGLITAGTTIAYTTTQPTFSSPSAADSFMRKILGGKAAVGRGRKLPADTIIMTPERWDWCLAAVDSTGRPLIVSDGPGVNASGTTGEPVAEGYLGQLRGLPVYGDANIPTTLGAATNQDVVFVLRRADMWLWETDADLRSFDATLAEANDVLYRVVGYAAWIPHRHAASDQVIAGTGLVAPTF